jgi:hypothetical protein
MKAHEEFLPWDDLQQELENLKLALDVNDINLIKGMLKLLVPGYLENSDKEISKAQSSMMQVKSNLSPFAMDLKS